MSDAITTRKLPCRLSDSEILDRYRDADRLRQKSREEDLTLEAARKHHKNETGSLAEKVEQLESSARAGIEHRLVECKVLQDFAALRVVHVRTDPAEAWPDGSTAEVHERPMTEDERQSTLPLEGEPGEQHAVEVHGELAGDPEERAERPKPSPARAGFRPEAP